LKTTSSSARQTQGGQGLVTSATATAGSSIPVEVGPNDASITVTNSSTGGENKISTTPGKDTTVPIPNVPPGTLIYITIGRGANRRTILVEVVSTGP
jgi:hypothetical protein